MSCTNDASKPGAGAIGAVRAPLAKAARAAHPLIEDPFAEPLMRTMGAHFATRFARAELDPADVERPAYRWSSQRRADGSVVRTRFFDRFVAHATAAGIRQAVILGAGLDTRAYRLGWPAGTTVFEIDQPEVLERKAATMARLGAKPKVDIRTVPVDLRHEWPNRLLDSGFTAPLPTAWIAEGVLPFLTPVAHDRLLDYVTAFSASGSRLATEDVAGTGHPDNPIPRRVGNSSSRKKCRDVATYLQRYGWQSIGTTTGNLPADDRVQEMHPDAGQSGLGGSVYYVSFLQRKRARGTEYRGPR